MSRHNKGKGFSQTSKRYDGNIKEQRRAAHNKQMDHSSDVQGESQSENQAAGEKNSNTSRRQ